MMQRKLSFLWFFAFCAVFCIFVAGCFSPKEAQEPLYEQEAVKFKDDTVYCNEYLGISYTVPKGWWLYDANEDNFSTNQGETSDPAALDIEYFEYDDSAYIDLISFANLQYSRQDNHLGLELYAQSVYGLDALDSFMEFFESYMLEPGEHTTYKLLDSGSITGNGISFAKRTFQVSKENNADYCLLTLTYPLKDRFFLNIVSSYWPANKNAEKNIIDAVTKGLAAL